jgi:Arc/MetJ family transcription regulator
MNILILTRFVNCDETMMLTRRIAMCANMYGGMNMATNLQLDETLIRRAVELGSHRTKKAAVTQALNDYISRLQQEKILDLFGKVDFAPGYDYKRQRAKA